MDKYFTEEEMSEEFFDTRNGGHPGTLAYHIDKTEDSQWKGEFSTVYAYTESLILNGILIPKEDFLCL